MPDQQFAAKPSRSGGRPVKARAPWIAPPTRSGTAGRIFEPGSYHEVERAQIAMLMRFDAEFYLSEYPDIAAAGLDPLTHFLSQGINEMRLPANPRVLASGDWLKDTLGFDAAFYATQYPDAASEPRLHFIRSGAREQRLPFDVGDNLAAERLLKGVLADFAIDLTVALEAQAQFSAETWIGVAGALQDAAMQAGIVPKPYRNNFWLGMALGLLSEGWFGAAVCCYNFFFNYYVPTLWLGNAHDFMIAAGRVRAAQDMVRENGRVLATTDAASFATTSFAPTSFAPTSFATVCEPQFLNRPTSMRPPSEVALPQPIYGLLSDVEVIGGCSLLVQRGHLLLYDYLEFGERARELQCPNLMHVVDEHASFRIPIRTLHVDEAFSLVHDHAHNYHHWLLELLPRYLLALSAGMAKDTPLLVEGHIAPQMREVLREVCQGAPPLIELYRGTSAQVKTLHYVSDLCVNSVHTERTPERGDILFSPDAIRMLRDLALPHFTDLPGRYDAVLIERRNVDFRRLINRGVLLQGMKALGLWSFDPGSASWAEQIRVFSNARLIVSEAGAALANLAFCRPGANVIVLVNGHRNSNFFYLTQLANLVGAHLYFFECLRLAGSHSIGVQEDMVVPVGELSTWVRRFLAEPDFRPDIIAEAPEPGDAPPPRSGTRRRSA